MIGPADDAAQAWRGLPERDQTLVRRGWPTLALALDRLAASSTAGGGHLSAGQLYAIAKRNGDMRGLGPWGTPPGTV